MYFSRWKIPRWILDFIPIGYVHCSYIVLCIASPGFGLLCHLTPQYWYFAIVWRGSFVYDLLVGCAFRVSNASLPFSILCLENVLNAVFEHQFNWTMPRQAYVNFGCFYRLRQRRILPPFRFRVACPALLLVRVTPPPPLLVARAWRLLVDH